MPSIRKTPEGYALTGSAIAATVTSSSGALFTKTSHGLATDDVIYIRSNIENYNGFWFVISVSTSTFRIKETSGSSAVAYINSATVEYYETTPVRFNCVHLPIVYEIENTKYPTNTTDTSRTVSSFTNDNGYINLNLSGSLGTFSELDFVKISGTASPEVEGVWQIIDKISTSDVTINLGYNSQYSFAGGTVILYYQSYHIIVKVYAGLTSSHDWYAQKPIELAATLKLIPDSNNRCKFSISEILKSYVTTENNLLLGTLPNNIDAYTEYYISYAESYDSSNGYTIGTTIGAYTTDSFTGIAVNAKLPFKNIYSGTLSEYTMTNLLTTSKFLTLFAIPVLFASGCDDDNYQDVSLNLEIQGNYELSTFSNKLPASFPWTISTMPTVTLPAFEDNSAIIYHAINLPPGTYSISHTFTIVNTVSMAFQVQTFLFDANLTSILRVDTDYNVYDPTDPDYVNVFSGTEDLVSSQKIYYIGFRIETYDAASYTFNSYSINNLVFDSVYLKKTFYSGSVAALTENTLIDYTGPGVYRIPVNGDYCAYDSVEMYAYGVTSQTYSDEVQISETKTFTIDCKCNNHCIRLSWLNNLGGFDYWMFTAASDIILDISDSNTSRNDVMGSWPNSYGEFADTIDRQTSRTSKRKMLIRSQYVSEANLLALEYIKKSVLVQIINSRQDRRTVIVDTDSFTVYNEDDKLHSIQFTIEFTDENPVQTV